MIGAGARGGPAPGPRSVRRADVTRLLQVQDDPWATFAVGDKVWCSFDAAHAWIIPD